MIHRPYSLFISGGTSKLAESTVDNDLFTLSGEQLFEPLLEFGFVLFKGASTDDLFQEMGHEVG